MRERETEKWDGWGIHRKLKHIFDSLIFFPIQHFSLLMVHIQWGRFAFSLSHERERERERKRERERVCDCKTQNAQNKCLDATWSSRKLSDEPKFWPKNIPCFNVKKKFLHSVDDTWRVFSVQTVWMKLSEQKKWWLFMRLWHWWSRLPWYWGSINSLSMIG